MEYKYKKLIQIDCIDLKKKRVYKDITLEKMAINFDVSIDTYSKIERLDSYIIDIDTYKKIYKALKMKVDIIRTLKQIINTEIKKSERKLQFKPHKDGYYYAIEAYNEDAKRKPCFIIIDTTTYNAMQNKHLKIIYNTNKNYAKIMHGPKTITSLPRFVIKQHDTAYNKYKKIQRKNPKEQRIINNFVFDIYDYRFENLDLK